jgi:hypothetical protein
MSALTTTTIARFDYRLRIAADLLRAAPRAEHLLVGGMAAASAAAAWPFAGTLYPAVAIPALLALAALIRHHLDGLDARRDALAAAGAEPADALVIQVAGPLAATGTGALAGIGACLALGRPPAHVLLPIAVGLVAALLLRRTWIGAPALAAGALAALVTAVLSRGSSSATAPIVEARSRGVHLHHATASVWSATWPSALAAALTLTAAQVVLTRRRQILGRARALAAAATRRLPPRSGT